MNKQDLYCSAEFQDKCDKFVHREVYLYMTNWVEYYQNHDGDWFGDSGLFNHIDSDENGKVYGEEGFDNETSRYPDIDEWWAVSSWLYKKLKAKGEVVWDIHNTYLWGRQCTGQAIYLDRVITDIVIELDKEVS